MFSDEIYIILIEGDCGYKPADAIRNFLSNEDVLRFIITREIINDPSYLTRFKDMTRIGVAQLGHSNFAVLDNYVKYVVDSIKPNHGKIRAEALIKEHDLSCLYIKRGWKENQGVYAHHDIALHFAT